MVGPTSDFFFVLPFSMLDEAFLLSPPKPLLLRTIKYRLHDDLTLFSHVKTGLEQFPCRSSSQVTYSQTPNLVLTVYKKLKTWLEKTD